MPGKQVSVGILGCGSFAKMQNIPNCLANKRIKIEALCDIDPSRMDEAQEAFGLGGVKKYADFETLLSDPKIEAALAATNHDTHVAMVAAAARHGKHILIEKPMTLWHGDSVKILRLVKQSGIKLCVDYNRPFSPAFKFIKREFEKHRANPVNGPWRSKRDGAMPRLYEEGAANFAINVQDEIDSYAPVHIDALRGGGQVVGESCHFFDLACHMIGKRPTRIFATGSKRLSHAAIIDFEDGSIATIHFFATGTFDYPKERHELTYAGALFINEHYVEASVYGAGEAVKEYFGYTRDEMEGEIKAKGLAGYLERRALMQRRFVLQCAMPAMDVDKGHYDLLDGFVDSILKGGIAPVDERRGLRATYLANLANESIRTGMPMPVNRDEMEVFVI